MSNSQLVELLVQTTNGLCCDIGMHIVCLFSRVLQGRVTVYCRNYAYAYVGR
jgi:hypothetical protein